MICKNCLTTSLGVDKAIFYSILNRVWQALSGLLTIFFIAKFFNSNEQGYYYTFGSLLSLQVFFELGLGYVVIQFISHEKAELNWSIEGILVGNSIALGRLKSLVRLFVKWYAIMAILFMLVVIPTGLVFFSSFGNKTVNIAWQFLWIWLVFVSSLNLLISPFLSVLEGVNLVSEVWELRFKQDVLAQFLFWAVLVSGLGLMAIPVILTTRAIYSWGWIIKKKRNFFRDLIKFEDNLPRISWKKEVFPFQWKIALSWASGYLIFQLLNPIMFAFKGAKTAGQMGMSLAVFNGINTISMAWINTKIPLLGNYVALKKFKRLDKLFLESLKKSFLVASLLILIVLVALIILKNKHIIYAERLLEPLPFLFLGLTSLINIIVFAEATYLRAHKKEPFLIISILVGLFSIFVIYIGAIYSTVFVITALYFMTNLIIGFGIGTIIFLKLRKKWHGAN